jgi:hypothetical protein
MVDAMGGPHDAKRHIDEAYGDDPRVALAALRRLIKEDIPWFERRVIRLARRQGVNWAEIGRLLHRSRQAVRERYGPLEGTHEPLPRSIDPDRAYYEWRQAGADARRRRELIALEMAGDDVVAW